MCFDELYKDLDVNPEENRCVMQVTVFERWIVPGLVLAGLCLSGIALAAERRAAADVRELSLTATDVAGVVHRIGNDKHGQATVVAFLSTDCPIARSYLPALNGMSRQWSQLDPPVRCYGVISDRSVTRAMAAKFVSEFNIEFPVLFDADGELASTLKPTHVPEVFVVDRSGAIAYRGRIDNTYADLSKRRLKATEQDLANAITAIVQSKPVKAPRTEPVGCLFESRTGFGQPESVTYNREIAPIIHAHCTTCHRDGEVAPFPLDSFESVSKRAKQIARVTKSHLMPPWRPASGVQPLVGKRGLSQRQIDLLDAWASSGAAQGTPDDLPPVPKFADGWQLGEPDLVVRMPEPFHVPADGPDIFQNFVIPLNLDKDHFCVAAEFRPGNSSVVHHAIFYLDSTGVARAKDAADAKPGYSTFGGPGFIPTGALGGWSPGNTPRNLPDNVARYVRKGSDLVIQTHYHPTGKAETDQSTIGLHFIERPSNIVAGLTVGDFAFRIPPGAKRHQVECSYTLPDDVTIMGTTPHMHLLGRDMKVTATLPDGTLKEVIRIDDWHFYWQDQYFFHEPLQLPKGTRLNVEAHYDNSVDNPFNPSSPPRPVGFGEETTDEMCFCFFLVATETPRKLRPLIIDNLRQVAMKRFAGIGTGFGSARKKQSD